MRIKFFNILTIFLFFVFFTVFAANGVEADAAARQLWLDAFLKLSRAEQLANQGKISNAIAAYNDTLKIFMDVHEKYPDWNTSMVAFRISSCRLRLRELETAASPDLFNLSADELRSRLQAEINRNATLAAELEDARQGKKTTETTDSNHAERQIVALRRQVSELETKLKIEQIKVSRMKTDEQIDVLRQEIADLAIAKEDNEKKIKTLTQNLEAADKQIGDLRKQLAEADQWSLAGKAESPVAAENELLKVLVADLRKTVAFLQEKAGIQLKNQAEVEKLERMALDLENKDDAATAARYWHTVSNKFPDSQEPALRAAYWYWNIEEFDTSNMLMDRYFNTTARNVDPMILLGRVSLDQNNWQRALALTSWAVAADPKNAEGQFSLGAVFLSNAQTALAGTYFRKAVELEPKHADALMALAIVCATSKPANLKEAKDFYERAVAAGHPRDEAFEAVVK